MEISGFFYVLYFGVLKSLVKVDESRVNSQKSPIEADKSPVKHQKSPIKLYKSLVKNLEWAMPDEDG